MKKFKYIHLLWQGGVLFNKRIVSMINDEANGFEKNDHLFVTPYSQIYEGIKMYPNVILESDLPAQSAVFVNKYGKYGKWVFLHGMCGTSEALKIKRSVQTRIIWRTWGHDLGGFKYEKNVSFKNAIKWILNWMWRREVRRFRIIGVANIVDELAIKKQFGNIPTEQINYSAKNNLQMLRKAKKGVSVDKKTVNVMVGHSGIASDNHIEMIDRLNSLADEDICLVLILSYGDEKYIQDVIEYVSVHCRCKTRIVLDPMPLEDYVNLLADMDVAVMDGIKSYALSNVGMLLFLEKKLYLNRNGALAEAFRTEGVPHGYTDEIEKDRFMELTEKIDYSDVMDSTLFPTDYAKAAYLWKKTLDSLE